LKQAVIAAHLDISVRTLRDLIARGIVPKGGDLDASRLGYIRHLRAVAANRAPTGVLDPQQEKAGLDRARRLEVEQRLAEREGRLLPAVEVEQTWTRMILIARSRLLGVPPRLASEVVDCRDVKAAERLLKDEIYSALRELGDPTNNERLLAEAKREKRG